MHILCVSERVIIGSGKDLAWYKHQAITWKFEESLFIWHLGTTLSEIYYKYDFNPKKIDSKMLSAKWLPTAIILEQQR